MIACDEVKDVDFSRANFVAVVANEDVLIHGDECNVVVCVVCIFAVLGESTMKGRRVGNELVFLRREL